MFKDPNQPIVLAGDLGGTKTLLGLFDASARRPKALTVRTYATTSFRDFGEMLGAFARDVGEPFTIRAVGLGIAGPVLGRRAELTNAPWGVSAGEVTEQLGTPRVALLNDLAAMALSIEVLEPREMHVLQPGVAQDAGNAAVIAAGTGLGEACLHRVNGQLIPVASEGGHADFAARTEREVELLGTLKEEYGRVSVEHVLSGPGLLRLHRFTHRGERCLTVSGSDGVATPEAVSRGGLQNQCPPCGEALSMFVSAYGAEAGNLALRTTATSGVFVGGGIAPQILPALQAGAFIDAFRAKEPMTALVAGIPVKVVLNAEAALLGAAVRASDLAKSQ